MRCLSSLRCWLWKQGCLPPSPTLGPNILENCLSWVRQSNWFCVARTRKNSKQLRILETLHPRRCAEGEPLPAGYDCLSRVIKCKQWGQETRVSAIGSTSLEGKLKQELQLNALTSSVSFCWISGSPSPI